MFPRRSCALGLLSLSAAQAARAAVFAQYDNNSYQQGTIYLDTSGDVDTYDMSFNDPTVVGDPTAAAYAGLTDLDYGFPEIISPFDPPADADQLVTVGSGGSITLQFPQPINVLSGRPTIGVFTGSGFFDSNYPNGVNSNPAEEFDTQSAVVSVSQDGKNWVSLGLQNLNVPENFYANATNPYQFPAPSPAALSDFGQAFTGTINSFDGENFSQILSTLNGSAGGTWLDLSGTGLNQINFVQFSEPAGQVPITSFVAINAVSASGLPTNGNVTLGGNGSTQSVQLAPGVGPTTLSSLVINTGSTLDLTTNAITITYSAGADPIQTIQSYVAAGEIFSSFIASLNASQSSLVYAIGSADGADGIVSGLSSGEIEIMPTLAGDAKLQGDVDFGDFQLLSQFFGESGGWDEGNFTYGSLINFGDFQLLAEDFSGSMTTEELASLNGFAAQFGKTLVPDSDGTGLNLVSVPEPSAAGLLGLSALLFRRARKTASAILKKRPRISSAPSPCLRRALSSRTQGERWGGGSSHSRISVAVLVAAATLISTHRASAEPVSSVQFNDGNVLNVQGVYGSGSDTAYLAIDFDNSANPGGDYAWEFNWNPATTVNGFQMLEAIAGTSILSTSGVAGTTTVTNTAADPNLSVTAAYFPSFSEHLIDQFQYGSTAGTSLSWDFDTGKYNPASVSATNPQGMTWTAAGIGIDEETLTNNEFIGFVNVTRHAPLPTLPETPVPLPPVVPATLAGLLIPLGITLRRRARRV